MREKVLRGVRESFKESGRESVRKSFKEIGRESVRESFKVSIKESIKESIRESGRESVTSLASLGLTIKKTLEIRSVTIKKISKPELLTGRGQPYTPTLHKGELINGHLLLGHVRLGQVRSGHRWSSYTRSYLCVEKQTD